MLIVLSNHADLPEEHLMIHALFEHGLKLFHVRKPEKDKKELEEFIKGISPRYYRNIVIHSHYSLIGKYNLKGIHLPEKSRKDPSVNEAIRTAKQRGLTVSTSVHSMAGLQDCKKFDYVFLSPVFDSISKKDYPGKIDLNEFVEVKRQVPLPSKTIGLGGINCENITTLLKAGFDGGAVLGTIWEKEKNAAVQEFIKLKSEIEEYTNA